MDPIIDMIEFLIKAPFLCCGWIIIGFIAGALARRLMGSSDKPFCSDIALGLVGAVVGGFITSLFSVDTDTNGAIGQFIVTLAVATFGAIVLILIGQLLTGRRR